ncbi:hypothetical protein [Spirochaeta cellobiosiphila]|uniref:hypothetical protein n=1 Tax=Spirochaeta cellobiosiphila TaxID=504483 RepID=UPI000413F563|nr:hypothetical protein [Spirochaeta cellobiosiphila]
MKPKDRISKLLNPKTRFWGFIPLIIPFSFQDNVLLKFIEVLMLAFLVTLAGKKLKYLYFVMMVGSVTFFHLLTPAGQLLYSLGPIDITLGSLVIGVVKGFTIIGMVFLSLSAVHRDLTFPGKLGALLGETFVYLEVILDRKKEITKGNWITKIDQFLEDLYPLNATNEVAEKRTNTIQGFLLIGLYWLVFVGLSLYQFKF